MVDDQICSVPDGLLSRECWIPQLPRRQYGALCGTISAVSHRYMQTAISNQSGHHVNQYLTRNYWNIVRFSGLVFFQGYISKITGVLQGAISKVIRHVHESSRFTQKKTLPFPLSRDERDFLQCPGSGEPGKMDWVPCHCCMIQRYLITAG